MSIASVNAPRPPFTHPFSVRYQTVRQRVPWETFDEDPTGYLIIKSFAPANHGVIPCKVLLDFNQHDVAAWTANAFCTYTPGTDRLNSFVVTGMSDEMRREINTKCEEEGLYDPQDPGLDIFMLDELDKNRNSFLKVEACYADESAGMKLSEEFASFSPVRLWMKRVQGDEKAEISDEEYERLCRGDTPVSDVEEWGLT